MSYATTFTLYGLLMIFTARAWGHGEHKPGPHGGYIAMPGAFHVELVPAGPRALKAYLLDIHFQNPDVAESTVTLTRESTTAECRPAKDHYLCEFSMPVNLAEPGELVISGEYKTLKGGVIKRKLPLAFK